MAAAFVNVTKIQSSVGSTCSGAISHTTGNALFSVASAYMGSNAGATALTPSGINGTWTVDTSFVDANDTNNRFKGSIASCPNSGGGNPTITVSNGNANGVTASIYEFSGMATGTLLDNSPPSVAVYADDTTAPSPSETNTQAKAAFIALMVNSSAANPSTVSGTGSGWTYPAGGRETNGATYQVYGSGYKIVTTVAAQVSSWDTSFFAWADAAIAVYREAITTFSGVGAVTVAPISSAGTATFVKPTYSGAGAVTTRAVTVSGTATFTAPTYSGVGAVTIGRVTTAGVSSFTAPTFSGVGAVTIGEVTASGTSTFTAPVYSGAGAVTIGAILAAGTATFTAPTYSGTGAVTVGAVTASGNATFTAPVYSGAGAVTVGPTVAAGTAVSTAAVYAGVGAVTTGVALVSGTTTFVAPTYSGTGAVTVGAALVSGTATFTAAPYSGAGAVTTGVVFVSGVATFVAPVPVTAVGLVTIVGVSASGPTVSATSSEPGLFAVSSRVIPGVVSRTVTGRTVTVGGTGVALLEVTAEGRG